MSGSGRRPSAAGPEEIFALRSELRTAMGAGHLSKETGEARRFRRKSLRRFAGGPSSGISRTRPALRAVGKTARDPPGSRHPLRLMRELLLRWLVTTIALYVAVARRPRDRVRPGTGGGGGLILVGAGVRGAWNALLRPLLTLLTCPPHPAHLRALLPGWWNAPPCSRATSWASLKLGLGFTVAGFWPARFWGGLVVSIASDGALSR